MPRCDVAIVGAGPYGLAAGAHLRAADGLDIRVFGETMSFWEQQMPSGMLLRSPWAASHIGDPGDALTLDRFDAEEATVSSRPLPVGRFVAYGRWFQGRTLPDIDSRRVMLVRRQAGHFRVELEDGETVAAAKVVVAAGIAQFAWRPPEFDALPPELVSHSSVHTSFDAFAGRSVAVVGAGQSAIESAALLHEVGADVEVIARTPEINWLHRSSWLHHIGAMRRLLYAPADVGPAGISWLIAAPRLYRLLPQRQGWPLTLRSIRPAAAAWLYPRVGGVRLTTGTSVRSADAVDGRARLRLDDGSERTVDHLLLATGYRVDAAKYDFLPREIVTALRLVNGHPELDWTLQSAVDGLYFAGAPAAWSFGPLMRFVAGSAFAGRRLVAGILPRRMSRRR
jgi:cation diffusion facilitator CzcD-associated flavoprotein CzcO